MSDDASFPDADELADCAVSVETAFFLNPTFQTVDGRLIGPLSTLSEKVLIVAELTDRNPKLGRLISPNANVIPRARAWLDMCQCQHAGICPLPRHSGLENDHRPQYLRVVDVLDNRIANISWDEKYVALSYVWGSSEPPKLYRAQLSNLSAVGSLLLLRQRMPRTISDAMVLVKGLGLRYLWFDSLCLIQDDPIDLRTSIRNMDAIYEAAWFTIVAAQGPSAHSGLPGVSEFPRALTQDFAQVKPGLALLRVHSLDEHLNKSAYATRGWTLQEQYLSRRTIVFVHGQAYFRCQRSLWSEETSADTDSNERDDLAWGTNLVYIAQESMDLEDDPDRFSFYLQQCVRRFQQRTLTYDDDAISAMSGILRRVSAKGRMRIWQGAPEECLPTFLLFMTQRSRRRSSFPSWSWAGWAGRLEWEDDFGVCDSVFTAVDHNGATRTIWHPGLANNQDVPPSVGPSSLQSSRHTPPWTLRPYSLLKFRTQVIRLGWEKTRMFDAAFNANWTPPVLLVDTTQLCPAGALFSDSRGVADIPKGSVQLAVLTRGVKRPSFMDSAFKGQPSPKQRFQAPFALLLYIEQVHGLWERRGLAIVSEACLTTSSPTVPGCQTILLA